MHKFIFFPISALYIFIMIVMATIAPRAYGNIIERLWMVITFRLNFSYVVAEVITISSYVGFAFFDSYNIGATSLSDYLGNPSINNAIFMFEFSSIFMAAILLCECLGVIVARFYLNKIRTGNLRRLNVDDVKADRTDLWAKFVAIILFSAVSISTFLSTIYIVHDCCNEIFVSAYNISSSLRR